MKHSFIATTLFLSAMACSSCNSNNANAAGSKETAAADKSSSSASPGDAVFSYNLDGVKVSGGEVDATQTTNTVWITKNTSADKCSFFLGDDLQVTTNTYAHSLRFDIPHKTGTVTLKADEDGWHVQLFLGNAKTDNYVLYANEAFSITVTSISATRMSGTFSGQLKLLESTGEGKKELTVTAGKFDLPIRNSN